MSLTDKEIALELTKAYLEHLNVRVNNSAMKSQASQETTGNTYQLFYDVVSKVDASNQEK